MTSYEWDTTKQTFIEVDDPTHTEEGLGATEAIRKAGYSLEFCSSEENQTGAMISVYSSQDANKPLFFIDIAGINSGLATLVARDFISLVETLNKIQPLLTLAGLDQFHSAQVADQIRREEKERARR